MGKFIDERCDCAPHSFPGAMESVPNESVSSRAGNSAIARLSSSVSNDDDDDDDVDDNSGEGRMTPGANVVGAKICFILLVIRLRPGRASGVARYRIVPLPGNSRDETKSRPRVSGRGEEKKRKREKRRKRGKERGEEGRSAEKN